MASAAPCPSVTPGRSSGWIAAPAPLGRQLCAIHKSYHLQPGPEGPLPSDLADARGIVGGCG